MENNKKLPSPTEEKLVTCPCCGSNACYESEFTTLDGVVKTWLCMTCGFTTNSSMEENSETLKQAMELTADLIKDQKQIHDGLAWFPTVITMPNKGMIFPEPQTWANKNLNTGEEKEFQDWGWTVVKAIPVKDDEKDKFPIPGKEGEFYKYKMDMKGKKRFMKLEFMDAAEELGMFKKVK